MNTAIANKKLTDKEKVDLLREILGEKYSSVGNNLPLLKNAIDTIGYIDTSFSAAQLIPYVNTIMTSSRLMVFVGSSASFISIFLFPVAAMISVINAYQVGQQMYAYRAIAYTLTAWAFNKPIPTSSQRILMNIRQGGLVADQSAVAEYRKVWENVSRSVLTKVEIELRVKNIPKEAMQIVLRAAANNNEQALCILIMKGFESKLSNIANITWKRNYNIRYPS